MLGSWFLQRGWFQRKQEVLGNSAGCVSGGTSPGKNGVDEEAPGEAASGCENAWGLRLETMCTLKKWPRWRKTLGEWLWPPFRKLMIVKFSLKISYMYFYLCAWWGVHMPWHMCRGQQITPGLLFRLCQARWILVLLKYKSPISKRTLFLPHQSHSIGLMEVQTYICFHICLIWYLGIWTQVLCLHSKLFPLNHLPSSLMALNVLEYSSETLD